MASTANEESDDFLPHQDKFAFQTELDSIRQDNELVTDVVQIMKDALGKPRAVIFEYLQEYLVPDILVIPPVLSHSQVYKVLRSIMSAANPSLKFDGRPGIFVAKKVAAVLYADTSMLQEALAAIESQRLLRYSNPNAQAAASQSPPTAYPGESRESRFNLTRQKAAVAARFNEEEKYTGTGTSKKSLFEVKDKFLTVVRDNDIPHSEQVDLLHTCLTGIAENFFDRSIKGIVREIGDAFRMLEDEFNSVQHQTQMREYLYSLSVPSIASERKCSISEALEFVHEKILSCIRSCGPDYQRDSHMSDFLYLAVRGQTWAREVLTARGSGGRKKDTMDYNMFYNRLTSAASVFQVEQTSTASTDSFNMTVAPTYFGSQYALPRTLMKQILSRRSTSYNRTPLRPPNRIHRKMNASQLAELKRRTKCNHCKRLGHWRQECPERTKASISEVARARIAELGNDNAAAAKVLWEMTQEEDEYFAYLTQVDSVQVEELPADYEGPSNEFTALMSQTYDEDDAKEDLLTLFNAIATQESGENTSWDQDFAAPKK